MSGEKTELSRRGFLKTGAAALALCGAPWALGDALAAARRSGRRPNVLFVFADQHRANALGCYGESQLRTPNLDALAKDGAKFVNAVANTPVCVPYRASLMTGLHCHNTGVVVNITQPDLKKFKTIGKTFKDAGYQTAYIGKWHLGKVDVGPGEGRLFFDDYWAAHACSHEYYEWEYFTGPKERVTGKGFFRPRMETDLALEFIRKNSAKPWLMMLSWGPPHHPYPAPKEYLQNYQALKIPTNVPEGRAMSYAKQSLPDYYGLVEGLDVEFGRLMEELKKMKLEDDTIVVYTSDHGDMLGSQGFRFKWLPYAESTQVPMIVRWPKQIPSGTTVTAPIGAPDIFPTLAGLAGIPVPSGLDGHNLAEVALGKKKTAAEGALISMHHGPAEWPGYRGVWTDRYMFARTEKEPWLLFDHANDPLEKTNLVAKNPKLVKQLDELTAHLRKESGDKDWRAFPSAKEYRMDHSTQYLDRRKRN